MAYGQIITNPCVNIFDAEFAFDTIEFFSVESLTGFGDSENVPIQQWFYLHMTKHQFGRIALCKILHTDSHTPIDTECFETERDSMEHKFDRKANATQKKIAYE
jgi:hypothetical protein